MELAQKAFLTALEDGDAQMAKQQLTEVQKLSDFLASDLENEIVKSDVVTPVGPKRHFRWWSTSDEIPRAFQCTNRVRQQAWFHVF